MITYGKSNLEHFQPIDDYRYIYFNIVLRNEKFDEAFDTMYDRIDIDGFQSNYSQVIKGMDYKDEQDITKQVRFIHLISYRGCWLPKFCCCVSCMENLDLFDGAYYYFKEEQLKKQLQYIRETMASLDDTVLLIPFCADNKMSKDTWSNTFLPAILDVFATCEEKCVIIPPLD